MKHDGKVILQLFVQPATRDLVRREAKARKITQSEFVRMAVEEKQVRDAGHCRGHMCDSLHGPCMCHCQRCRANRTGR